MIERGLVVVVAQALDWWIGDPPWLWRRVPHPVAAMGAGIGWLDRRWNLEDQGAGARRLAGVAACAVIVALAVAAGAVAAGLFASVAVGWLVEAVVVAVLLAQRSLDQHVREVADAFDEGGLPAARTAVSRIVGRDPQTLDTSGVCRGAIESLAENFSDGVVAPVFWYLLAGLPGLIAYKAVNTADSMIGHRTSRHQAFGWASARLDDLVNLIPARLAGLLIVASGGARDNSARAWAAMREDAPRHRSPNAGWPEAAMAGAIGIAIAGPRRYGGVEVADAWMNRNGRKELEPDDIRRALTLYRRSVAILGAMILFFAIMF